MAALLAMCSSVLFGIADFFGGMSARRVAPTTTAATSQLAGLAVLSVAAALVGGAVSGTDLALGLSAGVIGAGALFLFYRGLATGAMSVVAPLSAVTAAIVPIVTGLFLGETPGAGQWVGIALALPAVALISREGTSDPEVVPTEPIEERATPSGTRAGVFAGLLAGAGFGAFVSIITRTSDESGLWPLVLSRAAAGAIMVVVLGIVGLGARPIARNGVALGALAGVLDASSNVMLLEAGRQGLLVLVGVITSLYPASTVVLARLVLHERLQRHQVAGLAMAVVALVLVAI